MQKFVTFLEQKVEWVALGLAGLWVLWVVWAFAISPPTKPIGNEEATPATIDERINATARQSLQQKVDNDAPINVPVPDLQEEIKTVLDDREPTPIASGPAEHIRGAPPRTSVDFEMENLAGPDKVAELPTIPPPALVGIHHDRDQVQIVPPAPPGGGAPVQPANANLEDRYFVTVYGKFSENALAAEFQRVKIPQFLQAREYVAIELERQEMQPNGNFPGDNQPGKLIPPLPLNAPPFDPRAQPKEFLEWLRNPATQEKIVQPPFWQAQNKKWEAGLNAVLRQGLNMDPVPVPTADPNANLAQAYEAWKSAGFTDKEILKHPPEMRRALTRMREEERSREAAEKAKARAAEQQNKRNNRATRSGGGANTVQDPRLFQQMLADLQGLRQAVDATAAQPVPVDPNQPPAIVKPVAAGGTQATPTTPGVDLFDIWAHDETVEPGKIYRYRMRVVIRNPLYSSNLAATPELAQTLSIPGQWSDWTPAIPIMPRIRMFLASGARQQNSVQVKVFRWERGMYNQPQTPFVVSPGDMIGRVDPGTRVDYTTGWTIVDIRSVPTTSGSDTRVTLMDPEGRIETRYTKADAAHPDLPALEAAAKQPAAAAAVP